MSEYQVIARKWRPQKFADIVGQEHIIKTLKNAISQNRTAHAYLFVGPRGIGKTTSARIFAKALQCENPIDGEPCCSCKSCLATASDSNIDVIEIDAASQNSVENIRVLRDEIMHVPVYGKYKVYIIDEVHMLSKAAWNALLKTVEEPPAHAKFIFATTEVHMVLPTIISRCQRFDLQPIPAALITGRLKAIAQAEKVNISDKAINTIARAADGGMRDAQSLLDQMIAFFGGDNQTEISEQQVLTLFGLTSAAEIEALLLAMFKNHPDKVVSTVHHIATQGKNLETLFSDILNWLRGVQLCHLSADLTTILQASPERLQELQELSKQVSPEVVQTLLEELSPVGRTLHDALNKQVYLETIILKAMREAHALKIADIITRLNQLRSKDELKFLEDLPTVKPKQTACDEKEIVNTVVAAPAAEKTEKTLPPKQEIRASEEEKTPSTNATESPAPKATGDEAQDLWQKMSDNLATQEEYAELVVAMQKGQAVSWLQSTLTVNYLENDASQFDASNKFLLDLHRALQTVTGDWAAVVCLEKIKGNDSLEEVKTKDVDSLSTEEVVAIEQVEPEEEIAVAADNYEVVPPPQEGASSETEQEGAISLIDDPEVLKQVKEQPLVKNVMDLFAGVIVDIHA